MNAHPPGLNVDQALERLINLVEFIVRESFARLLSRPLIVMAGFVWLHATGYIESMSERQLDWLSGMATLYIGVATVKEQFSPKPKVTDEPTPEK